MFATHVHIGTLKIAAIIVFSTILSASAYAQVIVLQSTANAYKSGVTLSKSDEVNVPEGKMIVVVLPSGVTRTINGPFSASAANLAKSGGRVNTALFKAVSNYLKTGGATASSVGAVRSAAPHSIAPKFNAPFSWNTIYTRASGDICIDKNAPVSLERSVSNTPKSFTVVDLSNMQKAKVLFPAGMNTLPWPVELQLKNNNYGILTKGRRMQQVRIRFIDPLPAPENTLQVLHGQRCSLQLKAYLRDLTTQRIAVVQPEQQQIAQ